MAGKQNPLVQEALALLKLKPGMSIYEAAKSTGANAQSVYSAARRGWDRAGDDLPLCPACGQLLKPGQVVKVPEGDPNVAALAPALIEYARLHGWPATRKLLAGGK